MKNQYNDPTNDKKTLQIYKWF